MKILTIIVMCMLSAFLVSNTFAENETEEVVSSEESKAEMMLLKMEEKLAEHIEKAKEIAQRIESETNSSENAELLNDSIAELEGVLESIQSQDPSEMSEEELKEFFNESKQEIKSITQEFKEIVDASISEEDRERIKGKVKERVSKYREDNKANIDKLKSKIREKEGEYLLKKANKMADKYNISGVEELVEKYKAGDITKEEFVDELKAIAKESGADIEKIKEKKEKAQNGESKGKKGMNMSDEQILMVLEKIPQEQVDELEELLGTNISDLSDDEVVELIKENKDEIQEEFGKMVKDQFKSKSGEEKKGMNMSDEQILKTIEKIPQEQITQLEELLGTNISDLSDDEVVELMKENKDEIQEEFGKMVKDKFKNKRGIER